MWGWVALIIVVVVIVSLGAGSWGSPNGNSNSSKCEVCKIQMEWYRSLSSWRRFVYFFWYIARWTECTIMGCI